MNARPSIDIGIPAFNEEKNIARLIRSVLAQDSDTFKLTQVIVVSDGSTDSTTSSAKSLNDSSLTVIDHTDNAGKPARINEIIKLSRSDIVVLLDADVVVDSPTTIQTLIRPILQSSATLVSGQPKKINSDSFTDRVMDVSLYLQNEVKNRSRDGQSVYACHGRIIALDRRAFVNLTVPTSALGDDAYLYFYNRANGGRFVYAKDATVAFKMPQSLHDFVKQRNRFKSTPQEESAAFGPEALAEYKIPLRLSLSVLLSAIAKYHLYTFAYLYYRFVAKVASVFDGPAVWTPSGTTKKL